MLFCLSFPHLTFGDVCYVVVLSCHNQSVYTVQCVVGGDFYIRKVNELMDFLLLLSNGEMGEMGNILYDMEIDDQLGRIWQSWISLLIIDKIFTLHQLFTFD